METVFLTLLNRSIAAGWLVLAVVVLRWLLKKAPKSVHCLLWGLVGLRLLLPRSIQSAWSLIPSAETVSPDMLYERAPEIHSGIAFLNQAVNPVLTQSMAPDPRNGVNPMEAASDAAAWIWIAGMAAMALYSVISCLRLRRRVAQAVRLRDNLWQSERVDTPFILGLLRPRIYLPFQMEAETEAHVIAHEQAHLKRLDHWWKPLGFLLLTVYWFQPLLWLAYGLLCRDMELACDERVLRELGAAHKKEYAAALLSCSEARQTRTGGCPLAFGEVGVKQRVKNVLHYQKPALWLLILALAVCAVTAVCFLTDPRVTEQPVLAGTYVSRECLYMNPLSSVFPAGDSGRRYVVGPDSFAVVDRASGETCEVFTDLQWAWTPDFYTEDTWADLEMLRQPPDISGYDQVLGLRLSDRDQLLCLDGELWLVKLSGNEREGVRLWSVFALMPELAQEPLPPDFAFRFSEWIDEDQKNILDTYEGRIQKDLVLAGTAETDYAASDETLRAVYAQLVGLKAASIDRVMTSAVLSTDGTMVAIEPCTHYALQFTMDGRTYLLQGDATAAVYEDADARTFSQLMDFFRETLRSTAEYQSLPEAEGAYE